jgi:hypothetical protein
VGACSARYVSNIPGLYRVLNRGGRREPIFCHDSDARNFRTAQRLRKKTVKTVKWIAKELNIETWTYVETRLKVCRYNSGKTIREKCNLGIKPFQFRR